jgi:sucrose phosphorylase
MCLDYMVNHISPGSPQFQDYKAKGDASAYKDMFVRWKDIWASGGRQNMALLLLRYALGCCC